MKLSSKSLIKHIKGACYHETERGYLFPYHYSKAQLDYFARPEYDWGWRWRAHFQSCIRIELITSSTEISLDYLAKSYSSDHCTFDLYVDGIATAVRPICDKRGRVTYTLKEGEKRVTIYFPIDCEVGIKNFTLNGTYKAAKTRGKRLLIIGDSITQGYGPFMSGAAYANILQRKTGYDILAQGIGGYRFEPQDLMYVDGFMPDRIMVFLGTNYYEPMENYDYAQAVRDFFVKLKELYPNTPILVVLPLWRNNDVDFVRFEWCREQIRTSARAHEGIYVVDGFELVPNIDECFIDKIHPNAYGCQLLADNLATVMKDIKF
ncbi:MAG: SGNH/GDSL hydrolase family protein [Clostridia bacterium]|nr:SGNH/GDSL hydrolase family protein [Clostridia bacterium]